ncbi:MAG: DUF1810 domain-containing protein [Solirubrobacteraceae bacterium]
MDDLYGLQRFEIAQSGMYRIAVSELRAGRKLSHWMWFIFPQIAGLGTSETSKTYAISSLEEAKAYLAHPVLGPRLVECARILTQLRGRIAREIFGCTDARKLCSSMTLFATAAPDNRLFQDVLDQYFDGVRDIHTGRLVVAGAQREPPIDDSSQ